MSKKVAAAQDGPLSPYLSLRAAVRPAALAYALLTREQDRAGALVKEAEELLRTTRDLLEAAGLVHILNPGRELEKISDTDGSDDRLAEVLSAHADAGLLWARILGSSLELAETAARTGQADDTRRWVAVLNSVGEERLAKDVLDRMESNYVAQFIATTPEVHSAMDENEIEECLKLIRQLLRDAPKSQRDGVLLEVGRVIIPLAISITKYAGGRDRTPFIVNYIADGSGSGYPASYHGFVDQIGGAFETIRDSKRRS